MKKENAMRTATDETDFVSVLGIISTHRSRALMSVNVESLLTYWDIGAVYARLIEDVSGGADPIPKLMVVYASWMSDALSRFNSDLFYQSRGYIAECYRAGRVLAA